MKRLTITILMMLLILPQSLEAKKAEKKLSVQTGVGTAAQQATFTDTYNQMRATGGQAYQDWVNSVMQTGSQEEANMLGNLKNELNADGTPMTARQRAEQAAQQEAAGPSVGPSGTVADAGAHDLSDWIIETDDDGNVIGFAERDFELKDTDGDGEISDAERDEWNKKLQEEYNQAGGAPGSVPVKPEWDDDEDGVPNDDFALYCWQCSLDDQINECHQGRPGNCDNNGSCAISEICHAAEEVHDGNTYQCHTCEHITDQTDWCRERGYSSDPTCGGCPSGPCVPVNIDISSGEIIPSSQSYTQGSARQCYACMKVESIDTSYSTYCIRQDFDFGDFKKNKGSALNALADFDVSMVMGLSQSKSSAMSKVHGLMGSMGLSPLSILGGGMSMGSLTNLLKQGMNDKKNKYGEHCFDDFQRPDFAKQAPTSSSDRDKKQAAKNKKKGIEGGPRVTDGPQEFGIDPQQAMALDGPVLACGKSGKEKALMVMDSSGNPVAKILKSTLAKNPNAIADAVQKAQSLSTNIQSMVAGGPSGLINTLRQKAIAMAKKRIQDIVFGKKGDPKTAVNPNDQFFKYTKKKRKRFLGIIGGSAPKLKSGILGGVGSIHRKGLDRDRGKVDHHDQWGIQRIGYLPMDNPNSAWNVADGEDKNVIVAVIDSGIDFTHPDLPQYIWTNPGEIEGNGIDDDGNGYIDDIHGWNFVEHTNDLTDKLGHGTHVAGIIAAKRNNSIGIAGINPGAVIMPVKVLDGEGRSGLLKVYQGINYAIDNGAQVLNLSLGGLGDTTFLQPALDRAHQLGVFVVVASGNTGEYSGDVAPASANHAFTVSAFDHDGEWSTISSAGPNIALLAPGEEIISLRSIDSFHKRVVKDPIKRQYFRQSGTSFSAPIVAATASLLLTKNPDLTPEQIEDILLNTADDMGKKGWDYLHGAGSLNATEALKAANKTDFLTVKLDRIDKNLNKKKKLESVDIYATVRGEFEQFTVGVGKGRRAEKFKQMAGPFTENADHAWVARISKDNLRGSKDWVVNIKVRDKNGNVKSAQALLELE